MDENNLKLLGYLLTFILLIVLMYLFGVYLPKRVNKRFVLRGWNENVIKTKNNAIVAVILIVVLFVVIMIFSNISYFIIVMIYFGIIEIECVMVLKTLEDSDSKTYDKITYIDKVLLYLGMSISAVFFIIPLTIFIGAILTENSGSNKIKTLGSSVLSIYGFMPDLSVDEIESIICERNRIEKELVKNV